MPFQVFADATDISKGDNSAIKINIDDTTKISDQKYSIQSDGSGFCKYVDDTSGGVTTKALQVNSDIFSTDNILMGLADPAKCPLPGTNFLPAGYPDALAGEFILSGVICVVQSIILDSMFRVYCTILLWFYQILYAMMIVYIMFYGLAIVLDLTDDPIREAPKRIIFILFIFMMAVNAEIGFKWIFQTFTSVMDTYSNILTRIQPLYDEDGKRVYDQDGHLLAENGEIWQPLGADVDYVFVNPYTKDDGTPTEDEFPHKVGDSGFSKVPTSMPIKNGTFTFVPITDPLKYSPFRVPAQQWQSKIEGTGASKQFKVYPVFKQFNTLASGEIDPNSPKTIVDCVTDFIYNHQKLRIEVYPRCHQKDWKTIPEIAPYGSMIAKNLNPQGEEGDYTGFGLYSATILKPQKLKDEPNNLGTVCDETSAPKTCRVPFQGILGKVDALFDSVLGDDNAKSLASLAVALALWGVGGGAVLSMFLMTGVLTMFTAFVQIIWVYVTALMGLVFLMMLAPVFISFKLFKLTEPMFKAWVSMLISFMWQPIIVLGVVYVLSNATTLDRLSMLAKNELGEKRYEVNGSGNDSGSFVAPGFLEPLYAMPPDYSSVKNVGPDDLAKVSESEDTLISKSQREDYRYKKSEFLLTQYLFTLAGLAIADVSKPEEVPKLNNSQKAQDFLTVYRNGGTFTIPPVAPATEPETIIATGAEAIGFYKEQNINPPDTQLSQTDLEGFLTLYNAKLGVEDRDAFRGEPAINGDADRPVGEFPKCVKNCPSFDPPYDVTKPTTIDPTKEQCLAFCLYIHEDKRDMFAYMAGAMIIWVLLNAMTGAFMSKVPKLAEALSKIYDLKTGMALFGASKSNSQPLLWASQAQSDFYNVGGIFDTGLTTGRPGVLARIGDRVQQLAGRHEVADGKGGLTKVDGESVYNWGGAFGMKNPQQKRQEELATKSRQVYFKILQENGTEFNGLKKYIPDYKEGGQNQKAIEQDIRKLAEKMPNSSVQDVKAKYLQNLKDEKAKKDKTGYIPNQTKEDPMSVDGGYRTAITSLTSEAQDDITASLGGSSYYDPKHLTSNEAYDFVPTSYAEQKRQQELEQAAKNAPAQMTMPAANPVTAMGALGLATTGKNFMSLAKYLDPKSGKLNEKHRKQFEDTLKSISPTIPAEAAVQAVEAAVSRMARVANNDAPAAIKTEENLGEKINVTTVAPAVIPLTAAQIAQNKTLVAANNAQVKGLMNAMDPSKGNTGGTETDASKEKESANNEVQNVSRAEIGRVSGADIADLGNVSSRAQEALSRLTNLKAGMSARAQELAESGLSPNEIADQLQREFGEEAANSTDRKSQSTDNANLGEQINLQPAREQENVVVKNIAESEVRQTSTEQVVPEIIATQPVIQTVSPVFNQPIRTIKVDNSPLQNVFGTPPAQESQQKIYSQTSSEPAQQAGVSRTDIGKEVPSFVTTNAPYTPDVQMVASTPANNVNIEVPVQPVQTSVAVDATPQVQAAPINIQATNIPQPVALNPFVTPEQPQSYVNPNQQRAGNSYDNTVENGMNRSTPTNVVPETAFETNPQVQTNPVQNTQSNNIQQPVALNQVTPEQPQSDNLNQQRGDNSSDDAVGMNRSTPTNVIPEITFEANPQVQPTPVQTNNTQQTVSLNQIILEQPQPDINSNQQRADNNSGNKESGIKRGAPTNIVSEKADITPQVQTPDPEIENIQVSGLEQPVIVVPEKEISTLSTEDIDVVTVETPRSPNTEVIDIDTAKEALDTFGQGDMSMFGVDMGGITESLYKIVDEPQTIEKQFEEFIAPVVELPKESNDELKSIYENARDPLMDNTEMQIDLDKIHSNKEKMESAGIVKAVEGKIQIQEEQENKESETGEFGESIYEVLEAKEVAHHKADNAMDVIYSKMFKLKKGFFASHLSGLALYYAELYPDKSADEIAAMVTGDINESSPEDIESKISSKEESAEAGSNKESDGTIDLTKDTHLNLKDSAVDLNRSKVRQERDVVKDVAVKVAKGLKDKLTKNNPESNSDGDA